MSEKNKLKKLENNLCVGPCYPANYLYYNPINFEPVNNKYPSCPTKLITDPETNDIISSVKCDNVSKNYNEHNIFDETIFFCSNNNDFLSDIYEISDLKESVNFLNDEIDRLPYYSQKRVLNSIFLVYGKYNEFPIKIFGDKVNNIIKGIYKIEIKPELLYKKIINLKNTNDIKDIFINLTEK